MRVSLSLLPISHEPRTIGTLQGLIIIRIHVQLVAGWICVQRARISRVSTLILVMIQTRVQLMSLDRRSFDVHRRRDRIIVGHFSSLSPDISRVGLVNVIVIIEQIVVRKCARFLSRVIVVIGPIVTSGQVRWCVIEIH